MIYILILIMTLPGFSTDNSYCIILSHFLSSEERAFA